MDEAHSRWASDWNTETWWDQPSDAERFACATGHLNYQVGNGGFEQWWGNSYANATSVPFLIKACEAIGTPAATIVGQLISDFDVVVNGRYFPEMTTATPLEETGVEGFSDDELADVDAVLYSMDSRYNEIGDAFMDDCQAFIARNGW